MEVVIYLLIINSLLGFKLFWDWRAREKQGRIINHRRSLILDGIVYLIASYFCFGLTTVAGLVALSSFMYRGIFFDLLYNLIFKNKWNYCGENSKVDQILDKIDGKDDDRCTVGFLVKVIVLIFSLVLINLV